MVAPSPERSWLTLVLQCAEEAKSDRWRVASLQGLRDWRGVAAAWKSAASPIVHEMRGVRFSPSLLEESLDTRLAWAWDKAAEFVDAAILVMSRRASVAEAVVVQCFDIMRDNALIFPDGNLHAGVETLLVAEVQLREARLLTAGHMVSLDARRAIQRIESMQATSKKK